MDGEERHVDRNLVKNEPSLRSISNVHSSFIRFMNTTTRNVGVYWIDYEGQAVRYKILAHNDCLDVNTFVTHPWIFVDEETKDRFRVNAKDVFFPEPWYAKYKGLRRIELPSRIERTCARITLPVYSLQDLALRAVKKLLRYDYQAFLLELPRSLQYQLATMHPRKRDANEL